MLSIYSIIGYIIAGINILDSIIVIIRSANVEAECKNFSTYESNICNQIYILKLPLQITFGAIIIIISVCIIIIIIIILFEKE